MTDALPWLDAYPSHLRWDDPIETRPLFALLDEARARHPDRESLDFLGRTWTYEDLHRMVERAAAGFRDIGVGPGVKVGLFLPNCPQFVVSFFGILKAGGTVVNYSPLYSESELFHQIEDSGTEIMVTLNLEALYPRMSAALRDTRIRKLVVGNLTEVLPFPKNVLFPLAKRREISRVPDDPDQVRFRDLLASGAPFSPPEIDVGEVAVLQYTGGTTGVSKGAMLTHANLHANARQAIAWNPGLRDGEERMMGVLPFFHIFALTMVVLLTVGIAGSIVMRPRFELEPVLRDLHRKRPTLFPGVPTMYTAISGHPKLKRFDLTSIRHCLSGGAPLPGEVKERFEALSGCTLVEGYGLTECAPLVSANPFDGRSKEGSVGMPMPGTTITIVDKDDPGKVLPTGENGEICVSGPQVMKGYWGQADATADALVDGRLRTGDVGHLDEEGYLFIVDRKKDLILVSGFNVFPRNVEEAIYRHPAVAEVTVIGVPDDYTGEAVKAFVRLKPGQDLDADGLRTFLDDRLGRHERPKHVEFRDELPKTLIGKLSKKELVEEERIRRDGSISGAGGA